MDFKNLIKFKKEKLIFALIFFSLFLVYGHFYGHFLVSKALVNYTCIGGCGSYLPPLFTVIVGSIFEATLLSLALVMIVPIYLFVVYVLPWWIVFPNWLYALTTFSAGLLCLISSILMSYFFACWMYKLWKRKPLTKFLVVLLIVFLIFPLFLPGHTRDRRPNLPRLETKLEVLDITCNAGTPNLDLILINSGTRPVNMIPFDILVYDAGGKVTSLTRTGVNETYLSDSTKWKLAQKPGGYTDTVTITLNDNFVDGEYYSSILLRFHNSTYEAETSCQAN